jgi:hypothetical protein
MKQGIQSLRFADDQAVMTDTNDRIQRLMDALKLKLCRIWHENLEEDKGHVVPCSCKDEEIAITFDGVQLERAEELAYLGSTLTADE